MQTNEEILPKHSSKQKRDLRDFVGTHNPLFVLTGAGCSTASGIPDYRDTRGQWKQSKPIQFQEFMRSHSARQRYWARSLRGWPVLAEAQPNSTHYALEKLEKIGVISSLVTQNVDGLHSRAGQKSVIELHGNATVVRCMSCDRRFDRAEIQARLTALNPAFTSLPAKPAADGDSRPEITSFSGFQVINCDECQGLLKPDVVFFGEAVPRQRVDHAYALLRASSGMLVVGSSLMIYSGYRFCRYAIQNGIAVAVINNGRTRVDDELLLKLELECGITLVDLVEQINQQRSDNEGN